MIKIGAQYYRPPFPESHHWEADLAEMKAAGLNTLQMWVVWAWVEAKPGTFVFDDYDRIMDLAERAGLSVVLSTIAAIQPYWIHREVPGSEMRTADGRVVVSTNRQEVHYGLTPGGSLSHPGVWERMRQFLTAVVERYRSRPNLVGWDAWNELRWSVHAGGLVDYSEAALTEFRAWLDARHGGLDGLNRAWKRRYPCWEDVDPGRVPERPYTEMMAFAHFLTWRSDEHARKRYETIKALDPDRPVTVHGASPTVLSGNGFQGAEPNTALNRGNDWFLADHTDGIGVSSFPAWQGMRDESFSTRLDFMAAAAGDKLKWLSELQGGRSNVGFSLAPPVRAAAQQRWLWEGLSVGADAILFWCWRDEVFGRESAGFGLAGNDGFKEERLAAMRRTGDILARHGTLLESYTPDPARIGLFFSPQAFHLYWAQDGHAGRPTNAVRGYATALLRRQIPYTLVEECHLERLNDLSVLFMPRGIVLDDAVAEALKGYVERGGTLVVESETGAFGSHGLYRYPDERHLARWTGVHEVGRRDLPPPRQDGHPASIPVEIDGKTFHPAATQWITPFSAREGRHAEVVVSADGLCAVSRYGSGRVISLGGYLGDPYLEAIETAPEAAGHFEELLASIITAAGVRAPVTVLERVPTTDAPVVIRSGRTRDGDQLVFVFTPHGNESVRLQFDASNRPGFPATDLISGRAFDRSESDTLELHGAAWGFYVLRFGRHQP